MNRAGRIVPPLFHMHKDGGGQIIRLSYSPYDNPKKWTPKSTAKVLTFPQDKKTKKFQIKFDPSVHPDPRLSQHEIEKFLEEISGPVSLWHEKHSDFFEFKGKYFWYFIVFLLLLPLFLCYIMWFFAEQSRALSDLQKVKQETRMLIAEKSDSWTEKGLSWNVPDNFPLFMELRNINGTFQMPEQTRGSVQEGILMIEVKQKK